MGLNILVIGMKIEFTARVNIHGMMVVNMKEIGKIIIWMGMVCIPGRTAVNTKVNTRRIRSTVMVYTLGLMVASTTDNGKMEGSTVEGNTYLNRVSIEKVFGRMVREKDGSMEPIIEVNRIIDNDLDTDNLNDLT